MNVLDAIRTRRSVRSYATKLIPAEVMERMRQALRLAPSACNIQPWRFIFVTDVALRREVANAANGQKWMAAAACLKRRTRRWAATTTAWTWMWPSPWIN